MFEQISESSELSHGFSLELLHVLMLSLKLSGAFVLAHAQLQRLINALLINFPVQFLLGIVHLLHDVLLYFNGGLDLIIELVLQIYIKVI